MIITAEVLDKPRVTISRDGSKKGNEDNIRGVLKRPDLSFAIKTTNHANDPLLECMTTTVIMTNIDDSKLNRKPKLFNGKENTASLSNITNDVNNTNNSKDSKTKISSASIKLNSPTMLNFHLSPINSKGISVDLNNLNSENEKPRKSLTSPNIKNDNLKNRNPISVMLNKNNAGKRKFIDLVEPNVTSVENKHMRSIDGDMLQSKNDNKNIQIVKAKFETNNKNNDKKSVNTSLNIAKSKTNISKLQTKVVGNCSKDSDISVKEKAKIFEDGKKTNVKIDSKQSDVSKKPAKIQNVLDKATTSIYPDIAEVPKVKNKRERSGSTILPGFFKKARSDSNASIAKKAKTATVINDLDDDGDHDEEQRYKKRPSITQMQDNSSFIQKLRSRNNSLTHGILRTRSNSLTNAASLRSINEIEEAKPKGKGFRSSFKRKPSQKKMDRRTTTETRTYQLNGQWYEESTETTVVGTKSGTKTSTKTTTRQLPSQPTPQDKAAVVSPSVSPSKVVPKSPVKSVAVIESAQEEVDLAFRQEVLQSINEKRRIHGAPDLALDPQLNREACAWAKILGSQDKMKHKTDTTHGQNIYRITANMPVEKSVASGKTVVNEWYGEVKSHQYGKEPPGNRLTTGHFSQMVWRDTTALGVGLALSNSKRNVYVVTFFSPKGNWLGEFATQVLPPLGSAAVRISPVVAPVTDFNQAVLVAHNQYRALHAVAPLQISIKLNRFAQDWADTSAKRDTMEHRPNNSYGENLYAKWNSKPGHTIPGAEAVESWYSEIKDHVFGREPKSMATGHFTQLVWKDSTHVGIGLARAKKSGKLYVVCNYEPAGNFVGQFAIKVPPPSKKK